MTILKGHFGYIVVLTKIGTWDEAIDEALRQAHSLVAAVHHFKRMKKAGKPFPAEEGTFPISPKIGRKKR